jgi:hypothetical protein
MVQNKNMIRECWHAGLWWAMTGSAGRQVRLFFSSKEQAEQVGAGAAAAGGA